MASSSIRALTALVSMSRNVSRFAPLRQMTTGHCVLGAKNVGRLNALKTPVVCASVRWNHFQADKAVTEFLQEEINLEKQNAHTQAQLPAVPGFSIESTKGPDVVFTKKVGNESVRIRFNVNNSVDEEVGVDQQGQEQEPEMISRPPFVIEMDKGLDEVLMLQCVFPQAPEDPEMQEQYDLLEIAELAMVKKGSEWTDDIYTVQGSVLDGNLYDMLMDMMEDRGVTMETLQQMINFATSYEHKEYLKFLESLNSFTSK